MQTKGRHDKWVTEAGSSIPIHDLLLFLTVSGFYLDLLRQATIRVATSAHASNSVISCKCDRIVRMR